MNGAWDFLIPIFGIPLNAVTAAIFWRALGVAPGRPVTWWIECGLDGCIIGGILNAIIGGTILHDMGYASGAVVVAVAAACVRFWRKHGDRVKAWYGAKSRALVDALTARMPQPRPALIPEGTP